MNQTLTYYNTNAQTFIEGTINVNFTETQNKFIIKLPKNASILDFGCGSGRDTKYFLEKGYLSLATNACLCTLMVEQLNIDKYGLLLSWIATFWMYKVCENMTNKAVQLLTKIKLLYLNFVCYMRQNDRSQEL